MCPCHIAIGHGPVAIKDQKIGRIGVGGKSFIQKGIGRYEPVAEVLLNELAVDGYFLEYDDARSGDFAPLRFLPKGKTVVLGLVTTKLGELEPSAEVKRRIDEAARFAPLDQLALSPQCGFSSTVHGNDVSFAQQAAKIGLVVDIARDVWGEI